MVFRLFPLFLLAVLLALTPFAHAAPGPISAQCVREPEPVSDFLTYTLYLTFPTTGYDVSLRKLEVRGKVVNLSVRYRRAPGMHAQVLETKKIPFTVIAPPFPTRFSVIVNGRRLGPPKPIIEPQAGAE